MTDAKARSRLVSKVEHRRQRLALLDQGVKGMTTENAEHARKVIEDEIAEAEAELKRLESAAPQSGNGE